MTSSPNSPALPIRFLVDCAGGAIRVRSFFATREDAEAFVALLPRSTKTRGTTVSAREGTFGYVVFSANLYADGVNGGRNETGIRRYRTLRKALAELGAEVEWTFPYTNSLSEEEAEARLLA